MDQLPTDLLYDIFILLPFSQKQECMLVCRQWEHVISTSCLFHTLVINKKKNSFRFYKYFLNRLEQTPFIGAQVMELHVSAFYKDYDKIKLIQSLPNLRRVELMVRSTKPGDFCTEDFKMTTSKSRFECIREGAECGLTRTLAESKLCSCLINLDLNLGFLNTYETDIFPELKNMPVLKQLILRKCDLEMENLEVLHDNIPSLKELMIYEATFSYSNIIPVNISPVTSINNLTIKLDLTEAKENIDWLDYISQKYSHLEHFQYSIQNEFYDKDDKELFTSVYRVGYTPLLKILGTQLKSLDIRGAEFEEYTIIKSMDTFGCQIKKLVLNCEKKNACLSILSDSEQAKYIEDLTIYNIRPCQFEWIKNMKMLNSMTFSFDTYEHDDSDDDDSYDFHDDTYVFMGDPIENQPSGFAEKDLLLNKLLDSCSKTVKSIQIDHLFIDIETITDTYPFIEKLELCTHRLPDSFNSFISIHLPNLHHLVLERCVKNGESLILPNHHLSYFKVLISGHIVSLTTLDRINPRLYDANNRLDIATPKQDCYIKPISMDGFTGKIHASFTFGSVKKFDLNTYPLLLD